MAPRMQTGSSARTRVPVIKVSRVRILDVRAGSSTRTRVPVVKVSRVLVSHYQDKKQKIDDVWFWYQCGCPIDSSEGSLCMSNWLQ